MEKLFEMLGGIPFLMTINNELKINKARIFEALIIAVLTAGITSYVTLEKMQIKYDTLVTRVERVEKVVDRVVDKMAENQIKTTEMFLLQFDKKNR